MEIQDLDGRVKREFEKAEGRRANIEFLVREFARDFQAGHTAILNELVRLNQRLDIVTRTQLELVKASENNSNIEAVVRRLDGLINDTSALLNNTGKK